MPFINGRFYINPVAGQAVESAREAAAQRESASRAEAPAADSRAASGSENAAYWEEDSAPRGHEATARGPIHRIEIEAAEVVPSHSGHASRGFVARVHRHAAIHAKSPSHESAVREPRMAAPETHVFADHRDLLHFLNDELTHDSRA